MKRKTGEDWTYEVCKESMLSNDHLFTIGYDALILKFSNNAMFKSQDKILEPIGVLSKYDTEEKTKKSLEEINWFDVYLTVEKKLLFFTSAYFFSSISSIRNKKW